MVFGIVYAAQRVGSNRNLARSDPKEGRTEALDSRFMDRNPIVKNERPNPDV